MKKICKIHGLTEYRQYKNGEKSNPVYRCLKCNVVAVQKRRNILKEKAVEYKGGKCENPECGYNKYFGALEFHHLNSNEKDFGIALKGYTRSWENVKKELDKCIMLCSNCHREAEAGLLDISQIHINNNIPIKIKSKTKYCIDCNIKIDKKAKRCINCHNIFQRKIKNRPTKEILLEELKNLSYIALGKKYGVCDNTIRKWLK